jgi:hemolysin D
MSKWFSFLRKNAAKGKTVIEYLPDADEIERSPLPKFAQFTLHVLLVALASFGAWACFSEVDQVVVAQGSLVNPRPNVVVQPLETSIVKSVDVRTGQVVKQGDTLAVLDATFIQADENQLQLRLASLETQVKGLEQELSGSFDSTRLLVSADDQLQAGLSQERRENYKAQQAKMAETAAKLKAALSANQRDQKLVSSRLRALKEIENVQEKMVAQKYGAPLQLLEAQLRSQDVERNLDQVVSREQELRRELAAFEAEKLAFEKGWRQKTMEDLLSITRDRDSVKEEIKKADKRKGLITLVAPIDAVVLEIAKLSPGSIVRGTETFFTLVPLNAQLEAEVQIASNDVGYIRRGHPVHLKLDSFPFQRHGTLDANVRTISEDAFRRDSAAKSGSDVYYVSRITLRDINLKNMLENARLLPGMTVSAEIVVGQRSVISYLAWPLTKGLGQAIREPL